MGIFAIGGRPIHRRWYTALQESNKTSFEDLSPYGSSPVGSRSLVSHVVLGTWA